MAVTHSPTPRPHKSFSRNTYGSLRKCCKQKTYSKTTSFRCNTYKKHGVGASIISSPATKFQSPLYFKPLTNCPFSIPFVLTFIHVMGGGGRAAMKHLKNYLNCATIAAGRNILREATTEGMSELFLLSQPITKNSRLRTAPLVQRRNRAAFAAPPMQVVHRYIKVDFAARRFQANHHRFRVRASREPRFI